MEKILKTGYEWCLDANVRILDISSWDTSMAFYEESYYEEKIDVQEFYRRLGLCKVKADSTPRKSEPSEKALSQLEEKNAKNYKQWEEKIGGPVNAFLREYLRPLKLA